MEEKINIFDVEIDCLTAKEAMINALQFLESDSIDTIGLMTMAMLMGGQEDQKWKEQVEDLKMVLPGESEILEAARISDRNLLREAEGRVFLKMFMKYLQKNRKKVFLLAGSGEEMQRVKEAISWYNRGIQIAGSATVSPQDETVEDVINDINGTETDCILSVLSSPYQEQFICENKALLNARVWLGCGTALWDSYNERHPLKRLKRFFMKKLFRYQVGRQQEEETSGSQ